MEEYRKVDGYDYYLVSDLGNVKTVDRVVKTKGGWTQTYYGKVLTKQQNQYRNNYESVTLCENSNKRRFKVHQLVAKAFPEICGEWFDGCEIDHINGITTDNRAINLRVTDKKGNMNNPLTKEKCSKAWTDERRKKCSERMKNNNPVHQEGYWTEERRRAIAERTIGRHHTEESKSKMRGRIISAETRAKMSNSAINRKRNKEGKFICQ